MKLDLLEQRELVGDTDSNYPEMKEILINNWNK
jgi:hypothetical protein